MLSTKKLLSAIIITASISTSILIPAEGNVASAAVSQTQTGVIQATVNVRDKPSKSSNVIGSLKKGQKVTILAKSTAYFYKIKSASGRVGYVSAAPKYIKVSTSGSTSGGSSSSTGQNTSANAKVEAVIAEGMKYLGTPYEYGSDRNTTTTFDCSDFIRHIFKQATGTVLPADSRQQGNWVKANGTVKNSISQLKRGDLVFFMSYKGSSASAYEGVDKETERVTHVAMYLGDNKLLHTYSNESGGVHVGSFSSIWKKRVLFGGSVF